MFVRLTRSVVPVMTSRQLTSSVSSLTETVQSLVLQCEAESEGESPLVLDLTLGSGSSTSRLLETTRARVVGVDVDPRTSQTMARLTEEWPTRFRGCQTAWSDLPAQLQSQAENTAGLCDLVMLDLGPSTAQLEDGRGFAGRSDPGLLDMR